jgi:CheY-like chemotaxis protein
MIDVITPSIRLPLTPYFHPTTVVFVDDNESFLESLDLESPPGWSYRCFTDPEIARDFLRQPPSLPPLVDRCFHVENGDRLEPTLRLDLATIEQEMNHVERFERISVAVIDFAMPSVNGLDICAGLTDPYVRKALLTGVADEKVAVEAFNAGIIHRYIPKRSVLAVPDLLRFVRDMQFDYFNQYVARLNHALALNPSGFLSDPGVQRHVFAIMEELDIVEYYLVNGPPGFLLARANGTTFRIAILSDAELTAQEALLARWRAPGSMRARLAARDGMAIFSDAPEDFLGDEEYPWSENFVLAQRVRGTDWFVGLIEDPAHDIDFDPSRASYDAYLALR